MENEPLKIGDFVELDGLIGVVVGVSGDAITPEDHLAIWFGLEAQQRISEGGIGGIVPEVWTVPAEYVKRGLPPRIVH